VHDPGLSAASAQQRVLAALAEVGLDEASFPACWRAIRMSFRVASASAWPLPAP
jgi:hypothetical protein